ncbi:amino acid ABC transporter substrate-binding protein [Bradyrhizobium sp. JYMT SZCCT0428]|uniref:amino acid ABC transporter substrate-binding protein n=1 Tax=Bradyrhizobium sp. JYMT SZCCT0428 TaxID=2807673 RepID=UPI001BA56584|nr:amino acid ABC transporter substrate-binding protein [Bradyrhizobium sp. JYMT SZCCT0428]MBR1157464.1 amino acid ABC transporter substrate-binding protein [Bradyrhizobium sp. JYMT SZCCT0428]
MLRAFLLLAMIVGTAAGALAQELEGRLKKISNTGIIKFAYRSDANPFSFMSQNGKPDGYSIDLCKFISDALGRELNKTLSVEWVPVDSQNRFDTIAVGVADIECGASSVSFGRMTKVDFSSFIFMENTGLMVRADSGISSLGDLQGKKIAVIMGTTNEVALTKEIQRRQLQTAVIRVRDRREGIVALQSGAVESLASDKLLLIGAANADGSTYKMLPENLSSEPYALVLPRGDWRLRAAVNKALSQLYSSPQILDIYRKWFAALGERPDLLRAAVYIFGTIPE